MDLGLTNKLVLITGGSKGIGLACALAFRSEGARVAICSRQKAHLERAQTLLSDAIAISADVSDATSAAQVIGSLEDQAGPIDILVNCAGAAKRAQPNELTAQFWHDAMNAKFFTTIHAIDPLIKRMAQRGRGVIINVIGVGGKVATPIHLAGGAANAALMLATAGLAAAYASSGVRVVGVSPGLTDTERVAEGLSADARLQGISVEQARARAIARIPMGRMARPDEIAQTVLFLASEKASYVNGVTVAMDGTQNPTIL